LRYDTYEELMIINNLYHNELRLYNNFFQPVMKLASKERVGSSIKRKHDTPETSYRRLMESDQIPEEVKEELEGVYLSLNPAQLKRSIDAKLAKLYKAYEEKRRTQKIDPYKKLVPHTVTFYMMQQPPVGLPT
jgi:23S rRNA maturation-related 3'-5' exoribonuclease YhaM